MELNQYQALIFDLDGTLVDSMWMWKAIDVEFLARYGYDCPDDLQRSIEGMSFTETAAYFLKRFRLPLSMDEIKAVWTDMSIDKYRHEVPLKPGALRQKGGICEGARLLPQERVRPREDRRHSL